MKFNRKQTGNITFNILIVVALFAIAYFWYANRPEPPIHIDSIVQESGEGDTEGEENQIPSTAENVVSNIRDLSQKNIGASANYTAEDEPLPTPLNSVLLTETDSGNFVTIAYANLTQPGFIAIYKVNSNSETLPIGHTDLLQPTIISNLKLELDTVIAEKQTIVAVLHQDDGDGVFEFPESDSYLKNGNFIVSDVDVVEIRAEREEKNLKDQIDKHLEANF